MGQILPFYAQVVQRAVFPSYCRTTIGRKKMFSAVDLLRYFVHLYYLCVKRFVSESFEVCVN